jgi:hypothetical protein
MQYLGSAQNNFAFLQNAKFRTPDPVEIRMIPDSAAERRKNLATAEGHGRDLDVA